MGCAALGGSALLLDSGLQLQRAVSKTPHCADACRVVGAAPTCMHAPRLARGARGCWRHCSSSRPGGPFRRLHGTSMCGALMRRTPQLWGGFARQQGSWAWGTAICHCALLLPLTVGQFPFNWLRA